jgi:epsilon-lactone hydrolase
VELDGHSRNPAEPFSHPDDQGFDHFFVPLAAMMTRQIPVRHAASLAVALSLGVTAIAGANGVGVEGKNPPLPTSSALPYSSFLTPEVTQRLQQWKELMTEAFKGLETCGPLDGGTDPAQAKQIRSCQAKLFYQNPQYQNIRKRYEVSISIQEFGGIPTEVFTPINGVATQNKERVLINLHGGGFKVGSRILSHLESIPISAVAKIKVISVDYRMAPRFYFPAASEDVEAVYIQLLKEYDPRNIGIFGCSAGGLLTAQSVAWLQKKNLPMPGAVGMFCAGGSYWSEGDSGNFAAMWSEPPYPKSIRDDPNFEYLKETDFSNPLAYPVRSKDIMSRFPPSLLISSTRDLAMSSVVQTHSVLVRQGVPADLYIWEGLPHGFFMDPDLPQSREMYEVTTRFFEHYLGRTSARDRLNRR